MHALKAIRRLCSFIVTRNDILIRLNYIYYPVLATNAFITCLELHSHLRYYLLGHRCITVLVKGHLGEVLFYFHYYTQAHAARRSFKFVNVISAV